MKSILFILCLNLVFCSYAFGEIIFQDDFESYDVGTFPSAGGWSQVPFGISEISTNYASSGSKSLRLSGPDGPPAGAGVAVTIIDTFVFECSLYITADGDFGINLWEEGIGPPDGAPVVLKLTAGKISAGHWLGLGNFIGSEIGNYTTGVWYKIKVICDLQAQTYDVFINDSLIVSGVSTAGYSVDFMDIYSISGTAYFDDVKIYHGALLALDVDQDGSLESSANLLLCQDQTVSVDLWLSYWDSAADGNVESVDYYFTWDTEALNVLNITSNNLKSQGGQWDTSSVELVSPSKYRLGVNESGSGISDQDIKLHTVELQCIDAPRSGWIKASILPDGGVQPVSAPLVTDVSDATGTMSTICDGGQSTCTEENPCEILEGDDICPETASITENTYEYEPTGTTLCEGDTLTVFHTKKGSYTEIEYFTPAFCGSGCFEECFDNCVYSELQYCYLRCVKGCTNGVCPNWAEIEVCYEYQNRIDCNIACYNDCKSTYNQETYTSYYEKRCGFVIHEPITVKTDAGNDCEGSSLGEYELTGAGTAAISIPLPLAAGSYDICAGTTLIETVTVQSCGEPVCTISIPTNSFLADRGIDSSLSVTLSNIDAGGQYDLTLKRWEDDEHTIPLDIPISLNVPAQTSVAENGSISFDLDTTNPQDEDGQSHWANIIIKAVKEVEPAVSCKAAFDFDIRNISARADCGSDDYFSEGAIVYGMAFLGLAPDTSYNLYVVGDTSWTNGMTIPSRISGSEESFTTDGNGNMACSTVIWDNAQADPLPAQFDIVIDVNSNGFFDEGTDFLDGKTGAGFGVYADTDDDGVPDIEDNCWEVSNPYQLDLDGDCPDPPYTSDPECGDACDICPSDPDNDIDGDTICGDVDNCPEIANPGQEDDDTDGYGNVCDNCPSDPNNDIDGDTICGDVDNCPEIANPGQEDSDTDNYGDACDACPGFDDSLDIDDDGDPDDCDNCLSTYNPDQLDTYPPGGNEIGDVCDCEGNFDCDTDVDGTDAASFKADFGRSSFNNPCNNESQCKGDFDCDHDCDGTDAAGFKSDFGRSGFSNPCPTCEVGDWCGY